MTNPDALTVMLNAFAAVCAVGDVESVAVTVKLVVATVVGVPEITPDPAFSERPVGSEPAVTVQVTGAAPPLDCNVVV